MVNIAAAERRYFLMAQDQEWRVVAIIGTQCCGAAKTGMLIRFNLTDPTKYGAAWDDPSKFAPPDIQPTRY